MSIEAAKNRITSRIWQSIEQSGVDVSAIPSDYLRRLVDFVADGMLIELDALLDDAAPKPDTAPAKNVVPTKSASADEAQSEETVLWEGRPFLSLTERYVVTNERVRIITGVIGRGHEDIELIRVKDVDHTQGVSERLLNIGDVQLRSADASRPVAVLRNVADPEKVHEIIRRAMLNSRKKYPFIFEQEM